MRGADYREGVLRGYGLGLLAAGVAALMWAGTQYARGQYRIAIVNKVVDGDTFWAGGVKYRLSDIDTPELARHRPQCDAEAEWGEAARIRAQELIAGRRVIIHLDGLDRYGRTLARITVDGRSYSETLIAEGLALPYPAGKGVWCERAEF